VLTAEEAAHTSIEDVVVPMPGYDVRLPENAMSEIYTGVPCCSVCVSRGVG
jgi:hypothetical protein